MRISLLLTNSSAFISKDLEARAAVRTPRKAKEGINRGGSDTSEMIVSTATLRGFFPPRRANLSVILGFDFSLSKVDALHLLELSKKHKPTSVSSTFYVNGVEVV